MENQKLLNIKKYLEDSLNRPALGIYLKILSIIVAYSAAVHIFNLAGFGEKPWQEMPLTWKIGDITYAILDSLAAIGLWKKTIWGIAVLLLAVLSQFIIYTIFIQYFAFTIEQKQTIHLLLLEEVILLLVFVVLLIAKK
ncbi:MAG: DUF6163 family protein [Prochloraceae cyanobacterium]